MDRSLVGEEGMTPTELQAHLANLKGRDSQTRAMYLDAFAHSHGQDALAQLLRAEREQQGEVK